MGDARAQRGRRWLVIAGVAVVLSVGAAVVLRTVVFRDQARAVSTDEALDRFRSEASTIPVAPTTTSPPTTVLEVASTTASAATSTASTSTPAPVTITAAPNVPVALVGPGVYRYTTTGQEHVDALDGTTHTYPAETTITVIPDGCGVSLRWTALEERWDQWHLCASPDGVELETDGIQYHEFFGQPDNEAVACEAAVLLVPAVAAELPPVQQTCTLADDPWLPRWTVLERGLRTVADQSVEVQHVQMQIEDDDEYWEHTTIDWYLTLDGLPVEVVSTKSSRSPSPIGAVQYDERYDITLESLTPLR